MEKIIEDIKTIIGSVNIRAYIVGGYIRDKLLNVKNQPMGLDIVVDGDVKAFIDKLEEKGYKLYSTNEKGQEYIAGIHGNILDVAVIKKGNIEEDLELRDFTMDAIALNLTDNTIIDPFGGRLHIKRRIIQEVNEKSIADDPVRILRGIRFYIKYGMHFSAYTEVHIKEEAKNIMNSSKERILDEIMDIIHNDEGGVFFEVADQSFVLEHLLPDIKELKTIGKCKYHVVDVFTHMNTAYHVFKDIVKGILKPYNINLDELNKSIGNYTALDYTAFAIFVHDIGKYRSYNNSGDRISFKGHNEVGTKIMEDYMERLGFPEEGRNIVYNIVKNHMYPLMIYKNKDKRCKEEFHKFFSTFEEYSPYILLASFCDLYATWMYFDPNKEKDRYKEFIALMNDEYGIYKSIKK